MNSFELNAAIRKGIDNLLERAHDKEQSGDKRWSFETIEGEQICGRFYSTPIGGPSDIHLQIAVRNEVFDHTQPAIDCLFKILSNRA